MTTYVDDDDPDRREWDAPRRADLRRAPCGCTIDLRQGIPGRFDKCAEHERADRERLRRAFPDSWFRE